MKKFISTIMALAIAGVVSAYAGTPVIKKLADSEKYSIAVGHVTMTIDAGSGAKILSFKYDDKEVISQLQRFNAFGSTFWTSPQSEWNWPPVAEYDRMAYQVEQKDNSLIMTGKKSQKFGYSIRKEFKADAKAEAIVVTYSIVNESGEVRKVAPWEITRVPGAGLIFFDAPADQITPAGKLDFASQYGVSWWSYNESKDQRKINADGKGWLAYANDGLLLVKKFQDLRPDQPAPNEAEVQVYVNEGKTFIELESQGAYTTLNPGESLNYTVKWYVQPIKGDAVPSKKLAKAAKKLAK